MKVSQAIVKRRSIRGYKKDRVPDNIIREIFEIARQSASNCNTQPWHVAVVSGEKRQELEKNIVTELMSGKAPSAAFQPGDQGLEGVYKDRQYACAADYYGTMGIERSDKAARQDLMLKNWQFFGAPHVAFLSMPKSMGPVNAMDIGIYLQSLMLLFVEYGLESCAQGALAFYPDAVFEMCDIPKENGILCGISFGYADENAKINEAKMPRAPLSETAIFIS